MCQNLTQLPYAQYLAFPGNFHGGIPLTVSHMAELAGAACSLLPNLFLAGIQ
jgi:hypothetical protein